ncbi:TetR/AcrR family transcriptional regulator [Xanthobacter sp. DSM 24535]|uniref:TetR/AcrR family transcriptional regulator n=1 Tax=Roseixanthobacter psychrophilus TaxID=3119917 RepID=UPI00372B6821
MNVKAVRQRLDPAKRSELILDAALQLFGTSHYSIVTVRDIALACGINVGLIYHYFENKDHLFRRVLAHALNQIMVGYEERRGVRENDPLSDIGAWLDIQITIAPTVTRMVKIMADYAALNARDAEVDQLIANFYRDERVLVEETLARGIAAGMYRPVDAAKMARLIGLHLDGIFHASASRGDDRIADDIEELREFLLHFLGVRSNALPQPKRP